MHKYFFGLIYYLPRNSGVKHTHTKTLNGIRFRDMVMILIIIIVYIIELLMMVFN